MKPACLLLFLAASAFGTNVCDPDHFEGTYGVLLSGNTTISGGAKAVASVGRIAFDGTGKLTGYSSVNFTGLFLGNPITGTYTIQKDCSFLWSLQDDSGNFQHFAATLTSDGARMPFSQTDPGGAQRGLLVRTADRCTPGNFLGRYRFNMSGSTVDMDTGEVSGKVSVQGVLEARPDGGLNVPAIQGTPGSGSFQLGDDCFVSLVLRLPDADGELKFRMILVNSGNEAVGIESDPGTTVTIRLGRQMPAPF